MTTTIPKLTASQAKHYNRMTILADELSRLNARVAALTEEKKDIATKLEASFEQHGTDMMRLSAKIIVQRCVTTVPEKVITRSAYSFTRWKEVQG